MKLTRVLTATGRAATGRSAPLIMAALIFSAHPALAQGVLEEVVVTAQKREQSLQDVGIAITAFTGEQMNVLGIEESFDIAAFSPGVHISGNLAGQNTQFSIRGATQNDFNDVIEAPTAVYLDEGYIAVAQAQTFAVFDVSRAEILKGPQGTLYGRNATGGLVNYISNKPNFDGPEGYVDVTYGLFDSPANADHIRVQAAHGAPLSDTVAGRLAVMYNQHDGYLKNLYPLGAVGAPPGVGAGADMGDDDTLAWRGSLLFEPKDDLSISLSANFAKSDVATGPYQSKPTTGIYNANGELVNVVDTPPGETRRSIAADGSDFGSDQDDNGMQDDFFNNATGAFGADGIVDVGRPPGTDFFGYLDPDGEDFRTSGDFAFADSGFTDTWGLNGRIEYQLTDAISLTLVTDYKDYEKLLFIDVDSAPVNQLANYAGADATSFTQEARLTGRTENSNWVLGLYYLNIDTDSDNGLKITPNGVAGPAQDVGTDAMLETDSYSVFGQYEYAFNDRITLIGGLRLIQEEKEFDMDAGLYIQSADARVIHSGIKIYPVPGTSFSGDTSKTLWAGKLQLDFHAADDLLLYAGVNRGVKAGSFNAPLLGSYVSLLFRGNGNDDIPYQEEILWSYEAGFKATLFNGTTRLNGSAFYYDYKDYQAFLFTGVGGVVINADMENYGMELELQSSPFAGFDFLAAVSAFDATVEDVPNSIGSAILLDVDPTYAPEFQFTVMARYEWPLFNGMMNIHGNLSYSDEYYYNLRNYDADKFDDYTMVNAGLGWTSADEHWQANFRVNNVTDERAGIQGFDIATACGCNEISFRAPRWFGVNVRYEY
ncbi:MAG: TonB-dependent receptor [Gammaproteobacteria bacterium]|nr:TonB-dependent receptor [Gammaproteobacteria bacterium]